MNENLLPDSLERIARTTSRAHLEKYFVEGETAKQLLRKAGFGISGVSLLDTVKLAINFVKDNL
jgi:hypothetical protein